MPAGTRHCTHARTFCVKTGRQTAHGQAGQTGQCHLCLPHHCLTSFFLFLHAPLFAPLYTYLLFLFCAPALPLASAALLQGGPRPLCFASCLITSPSSLTWHLFLPATYFSSSRSSYLCCPLLPLPITGRKEEEEGWEGGRKGAPLSVCIHICTCLPRTPLCWLAWATAHLHLQNLSSSLPSLSLSFCLPLPALIIILLHTHMEGGKEGLLGRGLTSLRRSVCPHLHHPSPLFFSASSCPFHERLEKKEGGTPAASLQHLSRRRSPFTRPSFIFLFMHNTLPLFLHSPHLIFLFASFSLRSGQWGPGGGGGLVCINSACCLSFLFTLPHTHFPRCVLDTLAQRALFLARVARWLFMLRAAASLFAHSSCCGKGAGACHCSRINNHIFLSFASLRLLGRDVAI